MNQDFLNWQEAIHMSPLSDRVCTGKGRGRRRLVDLARRDKNIVWWAPLSVFRGSDGHSSPPVRPPWQWLALSCSLPGLLCRWPARWRCQHKSGCSLSHNHSLLASALIFPLYFHFWSLHYSSVLSGTNLAVNLTPVHKCSVSLDFFILAGPTFDLFYLIESVLCCNMGENTHIKKKTHCCRRWRFSPAEGEVWSAHCLGHYRAALGSSHTLELYTQQLGPDHEACGEESGADKSDMTCQFDTTSSNVWSSSDVCLTHSEPSVTISESMRVLVLLLCVLSTLSTSTLMKSSHYGANN